VKLAVTALAARTPCGDTAAETAASIRAGLLTLAEDPRYLTLAAKPDAERAPARTARVPELDPELAGEARLRALVEPLLAELFASAEHLRRDARRVALLLSLPARDAVTDRWSLDAFGPDLAARLGLPVALVAARREGHTGMLSLLAEAASLCDRGAAAACLVAGVDTLTGAPRLALLDEAGRLRSPRNLDGYFPGEGASALVVEPPRRVESRGDRPALAVLGLGLGGEPETWRSAKPSTGRGLTDALRGALGEGALRWGICDFNGESYRGYEWGVVQARVGERVGGLSRLSYPARSTGDLGAATSGVMLALAAEGFARGWARVDEAVIWSGSDGPERAAARVGKP
jgi:3-oxoacyl-[acyl-carrier-protein] synthase-1